MTTTTRFQYPQGHDRPTTRLHEILRRGRLSHTTRKKYRLILDRWVLFAGSDPRGWTRVNADRFRDLLVSEGKSAAAITMYMAALKYVSKWYASTDGGEDFAVLQPIEFANATAPQPTRVLFPEQVEQLLQTCVAGKNSLLDLRDLAMMIIGLDTGMRVSGLESLDFGTIGEQSTGPSGLYPSAKISVKGRGGNKTFLVPLSDTCLAALGTWHRAIGEPKRGPVLRRLVKHHVQSRGETVYKPSAEGISTTSIYKIVVERAEQAGIGHVHPHVFRHSFITWREQAKVPDAVIASVTGHTVPDRGAMERYLNMEALGEEGRKTTPPWFAQLARRLLKEFS